MYKGKEPLREGTQRGGTSRTIYGGTSSLDVYDPRRERLADGSEINELNARRPNGNASGGRRAIILWEKQRGKIWRREVDTRKRVEERKRRSADNETLRSLDLVKRRPYVAGIWREYAARLADELYTSDIEKVDIVDERGNPLLYINARPTCW